MARLKKAREDAEFKKRMTERSNFSATNGIKKARKTVKKLSEVQGEFRVEPAENNKKFGNKAHFGGLDSSQILPQKNPDVKVPYRTPLHIPKHQSPAKSRPQT